MRFAFTLTTTCLAAVAAGFVGASDSLEFQGDTWTADGAIWSVDDDVMRAVAAEGEIVPAPSAVARSARQLLDFELDAELQLIAGEAIIALRTSDDDATPRGYRLRVRPDKIQLEDRLGAVLASSGAKTIVDRTGSPRTVRQIPAAASVGFSNWRNLHIRAVANHIAVEIDGRTKLELVDQRFHLRSRQGGLQLEVDAGPVDFRLRNLRIHPIAGLFAPYEGDDAEALLAAGPLRADEIQLPEGFQAELLYEVPREEEGSWVAMAIDDRGRIVAADHYGKLYRVDLDRDGNVARVAALAVALGRAQGLQFVGDELFVVVNGNAAQGPGLYRATDTTGDDQFDRVKLLAPLAGSGDHGVHGVVLSPDGKSLYVVAGNDSPLPKHVAHSRPPPVWKDDLILPRLSDPTGFATWNQPPNGWIARVDLAGAQWELVAVGLRNAYDLAFDAEGELFTFDSDMESDRGLPWYRPPRVCHVISGAEFGYRHGSGKWPDYYFDSVPPVVVTPKASPTGLVSGTGLSFPPKYQRALFALDWAYGTIYAVHLSPVGSGYVGQAEKFAVGRPLPATDAAVGPDGALYFITGGRGAQSGLYRITCQAEWAPVPRPAVLASSDARNMRRQLEMLHRRLEDPLPKIDLAWDALATDDRSTRYAARIVLEHQDVEHWRQRALDEQRPRAALAALLGLIRVADCGDRSLSGAIFQRIVSAGWMEGDDAQRLELIRLCQLALIRCAEPSPEMRNRLTKRFEQHYPSGDPHLDRELGALLIRLESAQVVRDTMALLAGETDREQQIALAAALRHSTNGWTAAMRRQYFSWFQLAIGADAKSVTYRDYLRAARDEAIDLLSSVDREQLAEVLADPVASRPGERRELNKPAPVIAQWTIADFAGNLGQLDSGRAFSRGESAFRKAKCFDCHRVGATGGNTGPDLTGVGRRFSSREILESIVEPSKVIADLWRGSLVVTVEGRTLAGQKVLDDDDSITVRLADPSQSLVVIPKEDVEAVVPSSISTMPTGLINVLDREEVFDLLAYLISGGDRNDPAFAPQATDQESTQQENGSDTD